MSTEVPTTLLVGNPRRGSRTYAVGLRLAQQLTTTLAGLGVGVGTADVVDLAEIGARLPARASRSAPPDATVQQAIDLVCRPGLLLVISPTFKGSYSGLLKLFLDMLPIDGLAGSVAVPAMTAGWSRHRSAAEQFLRPLLVELGAVVPVASLSVLEEEFAELPSIVTDWTARNASMLSVTVASMHTKVEPVGAGDRPGRLT